MTSVKLQILALLDEGKKQHEIKKILGCSRSTIHYAINGRDRTNDDAKREAMRNDCRAYIRQVKTEAVCADCKVDYPHWVLQFDHLRDKKFNIGEFSRHTCRVEVVKAEIAKCDIVCANCHANRTYQRLNKDAQPTGWDGTSTKEQHYEEQSQVR